MLIRQKASWRLHHQAHLWPRLRRSQSSSSAISSSTSSSSDLPLSPDSPPGEDSISSSFNPSPKLSSPELRRRSCSADSCDLDRYYSPDTPTSPSSSLSSSSSSTPSPGCLTPTKSGIKSLFPTPSTPPTPSSPKRKPTSSQKSLADPSPLVTLQTETSTPPNTPSPKRKPSSPTTPSSSPKRQQNTASSPPPTPAKRARRLPRRFADIFWSQPSFALSPVRPKAKRATKDNKNLEAKLKPSSTDSEKESDSDSKASKGNQNGEENRTIAKSEANRVVICGDIGSSGTAKVGTLVEVVSEGCGGGCGVDKLDSIDSCEFTDPVGLASELVEFYIVDTRGSAKSSQLATSIDGLVTGVDVKPFSGHSGDSLSGHTEDNRTGQCYVEISGQAIVDTVQGALDTVSPRSPPSSSRLSPRSSRPDKRLDILGGSPSSVQARNRRQLPHNNNSSSNNTSSSNNNSNHHLSPSPSSNHHVLVRSIRQVPTRAVRHNNNNSSSERGGKTPLNSSSERGGKTPLNSSSERGGKTPLNSSSNSNSEKYHKPIAMGVLCTEKHSSGSTCVYCGESASSPRPATLASDPNIDPTSPSSPGSSVSKTGSSSSKQTSSQPSRKRSLDAAFRPDSQEDASDIPASVRRRTTQRSPSAGSSITANNTINNNINNGMVLSKDTHSKLMADLTSLVSKTGEHQNGKVNGVHLKITEAITLLNGARKLCCAGLEPDLACGKCLTNNHINHHNHHHMNNNKVTNQSQHNHRSQPPSLTSPNSLVSGAKSVNAPTPTSVHTKPRVLHEPTTNTHVGSNINNRNNSSSSDSNNSSSSKGLETGMGRRSQLTPLESNSSSLPSKSSSLSSLLIQQQQQKTDVSIKPSPIHPVIRSGQSGQDTVNSTPAMTRQRSLSGSSAKKPTTSLSSLASGAGLSSSSGLAHGKIPLCSSQSSLSSSSPSITTSEPSFQLVTPSELPLAKADSLSALPSSLDPSSPASPASSTSSSSSTTTSQTGAGRKERKEPEMCKWRGCGCPLDATSDLLEHLRQHAEAQIAKESYACLWTDCKVYDKPSWSGSWLERHVVTHGGHRPFRCILDNCGQRFHSQAALERHVNSHFKAGSAGLHGHGHHGSGPSRGGRGRSEDMGLSRASLRRRRQQLKGRMAQSVKKHDVFDAETMSHLKHELVDLMERTQLDLAGRFLHTTFQTKVIGQRTSKDGDHQSLLEFSPPDVLGPSWFDSEEAEKISELSVPVRCLPNDKVTNLHDSVYRRHRFRRGRRK